MEIQKEIVNINNKIYEKIFVLKEIKIDERTIEIDKQISKLEQEKINLSSIKLATIEQPKTI